MTCSPSQTASRPPVSGGRERFRSQLAALLQRHGCELAPSRLESPQGDAWLATWLMDAFRRTGDAEVFDGLVHWVAPQMRARVRSRLRSLGSMIDPNEIWQDAIVNVYRYPDRFQASRAGAFAAWSSTIVDNAIRRHLRRSKRDLGVTLRDPELLQEQADAGMQEPSLQAEHSEERTATAIAFATVLQAYLVAYHQLGERERFVLQMVEVRRMRYAELATILSIRPEALKMVVFRARKRIHDRVQRLLAGDGTPTQAPSGGGSKQPVAVAAVA